MRCARRQRGMILPALLVLLAVGGLGWLLARQDSRAHRELAHEIRTGQALAQAREALLGFAATYRNAEHPNADFGYLPCPDLDGDGSAETCGTQGQASIGRLPYLTLNLPDLRDGSGECLWYAVSGAVKNNPKPDVLNWDSSGTFRLEDAAGQPVILPGDQAGHAVALVIAAGPPLPTQARSPGPDRCGGDPDARQLQHYVEALTASTGSVPVAVRPAAGNDRIAAITIDEIFSQLKRRPSYGPWLQKVLQATADCLAKPTLPPVVGPSRHGPVELGRVPPLTQLSGTCRTETLRDATANWADTLRYARCIGDTDCLAGNGRRCRGALIFGGERATSGQPRLSPADKLDTAHYLEPATLAALAAGQLAALPDTLVLPTTPHPPAATADVALCLP